MVRLTKRVLYCNQFTSVPPRKIAVSRGPAIPSTSISPFLFRSSLDSFCSFLYPCLRTRVNFAILPRFKLFRSQSLNISFFLTRYQVPLALLAQVPIERGSIADSIVQIQAHPSIVCGAYHSVGPDTSSRVPLLGMTPLGFTFSIFQVQSPN
jgi:hypothetical protein